jgi:uncharacterized membrane protein
MTKSFHKDIVLVILLTVVSIVCIIAFPLAKYPLNLISYIPIALFLPGYAFIAAKYPLKDDLIFYKRIFSGIVISALLTLFFVLISNIKSLGITLSSAFLLMGIFTILLSFKSLYGFSKPTKDENIKILEKKDKPSFVSKDLLIIFLTTLLAIIFVMTPILRGTFERTILGLFLILFLPGYSLIAALFPKKEDLDGIERAALSFGLSIVVTPLVGLVLNYTPWGIKLTPILISLSAFTLVMLLIGFVRRRRVPESEKFYVNFGGFLRSIKFLFKGESKTSKILTIILILSIILAISTTAYILVKPKQGETFTEFYLLGPGGKVSDYPTNLTLGQNASVIIGIINHENKTVNYLLVVTSESNVISEQNITLTEGNKTEIPYTFAEDTAGTKKVEFLLYKTPDTTNIYRSLHLFVNIS